MTNRCCAVRLASQDVHLQSHAARVASILLLERMTEHQDRITNDDGAKVVASAWRFSLRALLALMTVLALAVALIANRPRIASTIGFILAVAGVVHAADRFVASMNSQFGKVRFSRLLFAVWIAAGGMFLVLSGVTIRLYGATSFWFASTPFWCVLVLLLSGSIYSFVKAMKVLWGTRE